MHNRMTNKIFTRTFLLVFGVLICTTVLFPPKFFFSYWPGDWGRAYPLVFCFQLLAWFTYLLIGGVLTTRPEEHISTELIITSAYVVISFLASILAAAIARKEPHERWRWLASTRGWAITGLAFTFLWTLSYYRFKVDVDGCCVSPIPTLCGATIPCDPVWSRINWSGMYIVFGFSLACFAIAGIMKLKQGKAS